MKISVSIYEQMAATNNPRFTETILQRFRDRKKKRNYAESE
jgi:hypothetical protein